MFENYTEEARRLLFFARYEAAQRGGQAIEPEHLVLGLLRDGAHVLRFPLPHESAETIYARGDAAFAPAEPMTASVEIPFSHATQVVLAQTEIEADALKNRSI